MQQAATSAEQARTPLRAVGFLVAGISIFAFQDVIIKWLSGDYPIHQILFVRSVAALGPLWLIVIFDGGWGVLRTRRLGLHLLRACLAFAAYTTFYLAVAAMPLADATALFFSAPLFVTALSAPILGERVGPRRWSAVVLGFLGMLVMLRPGLGVFEPAGLLAVACAFLYTLVIMMTRRLGRTDSGASMAVYVTLFYVPATALVGLSIGDGALAGSEHASVAFLLRAWAWPSWGDLGLMAATGLIAAFGFYGLSQAYRLGEASAIAPFEYVALPWAVVFGYLFWGDVPGAVTLAGMVLVVGSGLYVLHRESVRGRRMVTGRGLRLRP
jgi:drug/metabolite transporter (DMT)-like permease